MMEILKLKNATVYRGENKVFDRLNLTVAAGHNTAILGPNGSGKTTLLKVISKELYPVGAADCTVEIFGKQRWNVWELRHQLGLVSLDLQQRYHAHSDARTVVLSGFFSSIGLYDHQTLTDDQRATAATVAVELGIDGLLDRAFSNLSTGEQRRCLLARALINRPMALILDEPTAGLDLPATFYFLEMMRRLMQAGTTIVLVTHQIHEIPPEIEQVILLKAGTIVAQGPKTELLTSDRLSELFDVPISIVFSKGYYQALPGFGNWNDTTP